MKNFLKNKGKYQIVDIFVFSSISIVSIILGILNFIDILDFDVKQILSIVLVVLALLSSSSLAERYGILEKIAKGLRNQKNNFVELSNRKRIEDEHTLEKRFDGATDVYLITQCSRTLFQPGNITYIEEAVNRGTKFKVIVLHPSSEAAIENLNNKMFRYLGNPMSEGLEYYKKFATDNETFASHVEYRTTYINITYAMMIVQRKSGDIFVKIDLYTYGTPDKQRRCFIINPSDTENINFYLDQWKIAWEKSDPYITQ